MRDFVGSPRFVKAIKLLLWAVVLGVIIMVLTPAVELLRVVENRQAVIEEVAEYGILGPLTLAVAMLLQLIIAVIPGHILGVAAGFLYGFGYGFLLSWCVVVFGGQALFYLTRIYGKPFAYRLASQKVIDKWEHIAERQGIIFFIFTFSLPIFPNDAMVYVAGLSKISARDFFLSQVVGRIPGAAVMSLGGAYGFELSTRSVIFVLVVSALMFAAWWKYGQSLEKRIIQRRPIKEM